MILFWIICALLIVVALAFVLPPALQHSQGTNVKAEDERRQANIAVYRDQLSELEADLRNGIVGEDQYAQDRDEIERRLLEDTATVSSKKTGPAAMNARNTAYLLGFAIPLWAMRVDAMPPESEALVVQVTGEQFAWNVHYAGPDGKFGRTDLKLLDLQSNPLGLDRSDPAAQDDVTTLNQLFLPVNKPIIVRLRSKDVIHSFGVPEFRVKQDAIPGFTIPIWFIPDVTTAEMRTRTGNPEFQYEIACAQLCGLGHAKMRGFVIVQTAEEFQKWLEEETKLQNAPDPFR